MITLENVTYAYPNAEQAILNDFSLEIEEGEFVLVIGESGAGKSTLLRCLNGLVPHFYGGKFGGRVRVAGHDPIAEEPRGMSHVVGFVLQDPEAQFVTDVVEDELAFAMENHGEEQTVMRRRVEEALDQLTIADLRYRRVSTLSGGQKQRVAIGAVLTLQPKLLVLDEPTSQLDPQAAEEVLTTLQKLNNDLGLTIILAEHRLERVVQYVDQVLYLPGAGQQPIFDEPREVLKQVKLTPPLVTLAKELEWEPLPLTIKEGRRKVRREMGQIPAVDTAPPKATETPRTAAIEVDNLWYTYDRGKEALRGVNLAVREGEFIALMGRNGAGKSTLLKNMVGLLKPRQGKIALWGENTRQMSTDEIVKRVGYVPQNPNALLFADTLREELDFTRRNHGLPTGGYEELLTQLGLLNHIDSYPRDLSGGERQRAALAAILVADPEIILLDEPTRGLDYAQKASLAEFLIARRDAGKTILISSHDVELVAQCADRVVMMGEGQIVVDDTTRMVMTDSLVFSTQVNKLFRDARFLTVEDVLQARKEEHRGLNSK